MVYKRSDYIMYKMIFTLVFMMVSMFANAQNIKDSIVHITRDRQAMYDIVNGEYVYNNIMHLNTHLCKRYKKTQEIGTIRVDSVYMVSDKRGYKRCDNKDCFPKEIFNSYVDNKPHVKEHIDTKYNHIDTKYNHIDTKYNLTGNEYLRLSGEYQRISGNYRAMSLGLWGGAALAVGLNALIDKDNMESGIATACVFGVGGLICEVLSINYQIKSGMMLQASALKLSLKF